MKAGNPPREGPRVLACHLRHRARHLHRRGSSRHPHRRGPQRAPAAALGARIYLGGRLGLLRLLDLRRRRREVIEQWYVDRFLKLRATAFSREDSYFKTYASLTDDEAVSTAHVVWNDDPTCRTCAKTSAPPASARPSSSRRAPTTASNRCRSARTDPTPLVAHANEAAAGKPGHGLVSCGANG